MNIYILCNDEKYNKEIIELIKKVSLIEVLKIKESDLLKLSCFDEKEEIEKRS